MNEKKAGKLALSLVRSYCSNAEWAIIRYKNSDEDVVAWLTLALYWYERVKNPFGRPEM